MTFKVPGKGLPDFWKSWLQKLILKIAFLGELCASVNQNGLFSSHLYQYKSLSALCNAQIVEGKICFISFHIVFSYS